MQLALLRSQKPSPRLGRLPSLTKAATATATTSRRSLDSAQRTYKTVAPFRPSSALSYRPSPGSLTAPRSGFITSSLVGTSSASSSSAHLQLRSNTSRASSSMVNASASSQKRSTYATIASTSTSTAIPEDPLAPSLSHLNSDVLPSGYEKPSQATFATFLPPIEQSTNDDRDYRLIRLDNGMECLLVSDPKTDKSAAGISVRVGHLSDPENAPGMAHFCEHLLFMGTEKYPAENDYNEYLSQNNGASNAFTALDETVYHFDVHPPSLPGALDRFAQFFIAPLFTDSCTEREILAVDSENKKNLQSDMWRLYQLEKSTSSRKHWYWRFGTGNKETLWDTPKAEGRNVRDELLKWYDENYSANVMKLVVLGKESLDDLTKLVVDTFTPVKNKNLPPKIFSGSPLTQDELKQHIYAQTVKNSRNLEMAFPCPDQGPLFASKPGNFVTHYLGHEGEGSILSYLKKLGWAESLGAGAGQGATGFDFFKISINLTAAGLANHTKVAAIVFAYIDLLRKTPPQEWAFKEQTMLNEIGFRFVEKGRPQSYVTQLCSQMQKPYPRQWLLSAPWLLKEWSPELVEEQVAGLTPENCRITVACQEPLPGLEWDQKERWYGTKYRMEPMSEEILKGPTAEELSKELYLPQPNSFIPSNLDILGDRNRTGPPSMRPSCIKQNLTSRLWHKLDDRWWVPRAGVSLYIKNPIIDSSALNSVCVRLYLDLVMDAMSEYSYDADLAGLSYKLDTQADGIIMHIDGYNDKLYVLTKVVLEKMLDLKVNPQRFEIIKDQNRRKFENFNLAAPSALTTYWMTYLIQNKIQPPQAKLEALETVTPERLQAFIPELLSRMHVEGLVHGNVLKEDAVGIIDLAETIFKPKPLAPEEKISPLSLLAPDSSNAILRLPVPNPENVNSAIEYFCYVGDDADTETRSKSALFAQLINEPCFDTLRTKEQLGYLVHSSGRASVRMTGFRISIQSEREAHYLEDRVDKFLLGFEKYLEDLTPEQFEKEKTSLVNRLKEDYKNLYQETGQYWLHIHAGYYDFERKTKDAEFISKLTKEDILAFFRTKISPKAPTRAKLSVHLQSQHISKATAEAVPGFVSEAGCETSEELKTLLNSTPLPLVNAVLDQVKADLSNASKSEADVEAVLAKIKESHEPASLGEGKQLYATPDDIRKLMRVGPPSQPADEYKDLLAKL